MPETVHNGIWRWHDLMHDLEAQGDFPGVTIDPLSVGNNFCAGKTADGTTITITWVRDVFMLISMSEDTPALAEAFTKVVGYKPFCKYVEPVNGLTTYEWDKKDPEERFKVLQVSEKIGLKRLEATLQEA